MALIIEAPNEIYSTENNRNVKLFLAGGITNCPDWQSYVVEELRSIPNLTVYNPRRKNFPIHDKTAAETQITWEFHQLKNADMIMFWFSRGSLNPIVLYELGMHGNAFDGRPTFIGIDPEYERGQDVRIQTELAKPGMPIFDSIDDMIAQIKASAEQFS